MPFYKKAYGRTATSVHVLFCCLDRQLGCIWGLPDFSWNLIVTLDLKLQLNILIYYLLGTAWGKDISFIKGIWWRVWNLKPSVCYVITFMVVKWWIWAYWLWCRPAQQKNNLIVSGCYFVHSILGLLCVSIFLSWIW